MPRNKRRGGIKGSSQGGSSPKQPANIITMNALFENRNINAKLLNIFQNANLTRSKSIQSITKQSPKSTDPPQLNHDTHNPTTPDPQPQGNAISDGDHSKNPDDKHEFSSLGKKIKMMNQMKKRR